MSESHHTLCLWFLVEGETTPFTVEIKGNKYVTHLKKHIQKEKEKRVLRDVDAADLVLWKVQFASPMLKQSNLPVSSSRTQYPSNPRILLPNVYQSLSEISMSSWTKSQTIYQHYL
jgi:Crinkler effector protein N-terminal domain